MAESRSSDQAARVVASASNLRIDAATAEVLRAFEAAGIRAIVLKGPALAGWYGDEPTRSYLDCDLWVGPREAEQADNALMRIGFKPVGDWEEHASSWSRDLDGVVVDLHRRLQGLGVDPATAWEALSGTTETVTVAGYSAAALPAPARALYVTLHAAHHGREWGKALSHLECALQAVDEPGWVEAASLAQRLGATDAFATGLRLVPEGAVLADRLCLPSTRSVKVALHASTPPPIALGLEQLANAASLGEFLSIIARKAVPPPRFMRHWWPSAARSRGMLALAYLYRPVWLLRHSRRGARAWLEARRTVRGGR